MGQSFSEIGRDWRNFTKEGPALMVYLNGRRGVTKFKMEVKEKARSRVSIRDIDPIPEGVKTGGTLPRFINACENLILEVETSFDPFSHDTIEFSSKNPRVSLPIPGVISESLVTDSPIIRLLDLSESSEGHRAHVVESCSSKISGLSYRQLIQSSTSFSSIPGLLRIVREPSIDGDCRATHS
jgi:hypothetical protein